MQKPSIIYVIVIDIINSLLNRKEGERAADTFGISFILSKNGY